MECGTATAPVLSPPHSKVPLQLRSDYGFTVTVFETNTTGTPSMTPPIRTVCSPGDSGVRNAAETM